MLGKHWTGDIDADNGGGTGFNTGFLPHLGAAVRCAVYHVAPYKEGLLVRAMCASQAY